MDSSHRLITVGLLLLFSFANAQVIAQASLSETEDEIIEYSSSTKNGRGNFLDLQQIGDNNKSRIEQSGIQDATIQQVGDYNAAYVVMAGWQNSLFSTQNGLNNHLSIGLNGYDNHLSILQNGNNNYLENRYASISGLDMSISQYGNQNSLTINLREKNVNGGALPSSIVQRNGASLKILRLQDFESAILPRSN